MKIKLNNIKVTLFIAFFSCDGTWSFIYRPHRNPKHSNLPNIENPNHKILLKIRQKYPKIAIFLMSS